MTEHPYGLAGHTHPDQLQDADTHCEQCGEPIYDEPLESPHIGGQYCSEQCARKGELEYMHKLAMRSEDVEYALGRTICADPDAPWLLTLEDGGNQIIVTGINELGKAVLATGRRMPDALQELVDARPWEGK